MHIYGWLQCTCIVFNFFLKHEGLLLLFMSAVFSKLAKSEDSHETLVSSKLNPPFPPLTLFVSEGVTYYTGYWQDSEKRNFRLEMEIPEGASDYVELRFSCSSTSEADNYIHCFTAGLSDISILQESIRSNGTVDTEKLVFDLLFVEGADGIRRSGCPSFRVMYTEAVGVVKSAGFTSATLDDDSHYRLYRNKSASDENIPVRSLLFNTLLGPDDMIPSNLPYYACLGFEFKHEKDLADVNSAFNYMRHTRVRDFLRKAKRFSGEVTKEIRFQLQNRASPNEKLRDVLIRLYPDPSMALFFRDIFRILGHEEFEERQEWSSRFGRSLKVLNDNYLMCSRLE